MLEVFADLLTFHRRSNRETYRHLLWAVANPAFYSHLKAVDGSVGVQGREVSVAARRTSPERVGLFSDAVFAVIITILVLELKPPSAATFSALLPLWPTGLSYAVSYVFIAIVWVNHHHLFSYAQVATPRLVWSNFAHLFSVSLIPFTTGWIADSRLAAAPVAMYAAIFVLVNITYIALCWEAVDRPAHEDVSQHMRRLLRMRSFITIGVFAAAAVIALRWPVVATVLICLCLIGYLRPDIPAVKNVGR